jgi:IPT/TIG domain
VYWVEWGNGVAGAGAVKKISLSGGGVTTLAANLNAPTSIDVDGDIIYWSEFGTNGANGAIKKIGLAISNPPNITTIDPPSGPVGTLVTITGSNFGSTSGSSTVTFGTTAATASLWSDTQIKVITPPQSGGLDGCEQP